MRGWRLLHRPRLVLLPALRSRVRLPARGVWLRFVLRRNVCLPARPLHLHRLPARGELAGPSDGLRRVRAWDLLRWAPSQRLRQLLDGRLHLVARAVRLCGVPGRVVRRRRRRNGLRAVLCWIRRRGGRGRCLRALSSWPVLHCR